MTERSAVVVGMAPVAAQDSPSPRAGARANVQVTQGSSKEKSDRLPLARMVKRGLRRWWVWTDRPASLAATWRLSGVSNSRIPLRSTPLGMFWRLSNWIDRLLMFALVLIAPTFLTGPLRWLTARPTRRFAFYLIAGGLMAAWLLT